MLIQKYEISYLKSSICMQNINVVILPLYSLCLYILIRFDELHQMQHQPLGLCSLQNHELKYFNCLEIPSLWNLLQKQKMDTERFLHKQMKEAMKKHSCVCLPVFKHREIALNGSLLILEKVKGEIQTQSMPLLTLRSRKLLPFPLFWTHSWLVKARLQYCIDLFLRLWYNNTHLPSK